MDKNKYPEIFKIRSELRLYLSDVFQARKKLLTIILLLFMIISGYIIYLTVKTIPTAWKILNEGYTYHVKTLIWATIAEPVDLSIPIDEVFKVPFNDTLNLSVPFKANFPLPIKQDFEIQIKKPIIIDMDHKFPIKEKIRFKANVPVDSDTNVTLFGISKKIHIKADLPVDMDLPLEHTFRLNDTIAFNIKKPLNLFIDNTFQIPVDMQLDVSLPLDLTLTVPMKFDFETRLTIKEKIPIIVEFDIVFHPLSGVRVDGIMIDGKKVDTKKDLSIHEKSVELLHGNNE